MLRGLQPKHRQPIYGRSLCLLAPNLSNPRERQQQVIERGIVSNYDSVEAGILMEGMTSEQKLRFHREMSEAWKDPKRAARLKTWLGGVGAHHFYLGDSHRGLRSALFFWTTVPAVMAIFEGSISKRTQRVNSEIALRIATQIRGGFADSVTTGAFAAADKQRVVEGLPLVTLRPNPERKWIALAIAGVVVPVIIGGVLAPVAGRNTQASSNVETTSKQDVTAQTIMTSPSGTTVESQTSDEKLLRSYAGKIPDLAFWRKVDRIFAGNLVGQGSGATIALDGFENSLDKYSFAPCFYDEGTNTMTVGWTTAWQPDEGDIAGGLAGTNAVSFNLKNPSQGLVAVWDDSDDTATITLYAHDQISASDAERITRGDLSIVGPGLERWAAALIQKSGKRVEVEIE